MANKRRKKKLWKEAGGTLRCTLCGRELWAARDNYLPGRRGAVCHTCLRAGYALLPCPEPTPEPPKPDVLSPQALIRQLDRVIAGQEEAKRAVALAVWKQQLRAAGEQAVPAGHLLLYGPTGCGKTLLATRAAGLAGLPVCVFDATTLSEAGYRGRDAVDILKDYQAAAKEHPHRRRGVVILDEIDKLAAHGGPERQAYLRGTQHTLLKLLEGTVYEDVDSADLLFILCGAFHGVGEQPRQTAPIGFARTAEETETTVGPEAFVEFGMERELMGRVSGLAAVRPLDEEDLIGILLDKEGSAFSVYRDFFSARGVTLTLSRETARALARRALDLGTGARGLKAELDKVMEPLMYRLAVGELEGEVEPDVLGVPQVREQAG